MNNNLIAYGNLCSQFYDITKKYSPEREVAFYASFIERNPGRVLEAMSGSGRLQIPLLQRGYAVDGVDNSPIMLERCRQRCAAFLLTPELYEQSLEQLLLPHKYTVITIAVGSFQLITEHSVALNVLKNLRQHMVVGGDLLIDTFTPDRTNDRRSIRIARIDDNQIIRLTARQVFHEQERIVDAFCLYELVVNGIVQHQENELVQVTWYSDEEFVALLGAAGFEVVNIYDESFRTVAPSHVFHARAVVSA